MDYFIACVGCCVNKSFPENCNECIFAKDNPKYKALLSNYRFLMEAKNDRTPKKRFRCFK